MSTLFSILCAFALGFWLHFKSLQPMRSWLLSCGVVPLFGMFAFFVLPYARETISPYPLVLLIESSLGAVSGGLGVITAILTKKKIIKIENVDA